MSLVYTKRLGILSLAAGAGFTVLGTVPAGKVWIVKCADLYVPTAGSVAIFRAGPNASYLSYFVAPTATASHQWTGTQALAAGEQITISTNAAGSGAIVSGYEFDA